MNGFIKVYRQLRSHWLWDDGGRPHDPLKAFLDLLMEAAWRPKKQLINGCLIDLERGQLVASQRYLAERWKWSKNRVMRFLDMLETDQVLDQQTDQGVTIITICNYERYQGEDSEVGPATGPLADHEKTSNGPATGPLADQQRDHLTSCGQNGYLPGRTSNGPESGPGAQQCKSVIRTEYEEDKKELGTHTSDVPPCSLDQAKSAAAEMMIPVEAADKWWHDLDAAGWIDGKQRRIIRWHSSLKAYGDTWRANERNNNRNGHDNRKRAVQATDQSDDSKYRTPDGRAGW